MSVELFSNAIITVRERASPIPVAEQINSPIVITVASGTKGERGPTGLTGAGVPVGGMPGQVLEKHTAADHDTKWTSLEDFTLWFDNQII
jgi:hypothetical protein